MSNKILFFGNEKLATGVNTNAQVFNGLIEAGYQIEALIISQKLDKHADQLEVVRSAKDKAITVKSYTSLKQSIDEIKSYGVKAAVLAAYGKIVPKEVLDLFEIGIINIHPSLLPKHRGSTPIESAILNGDLETGVSIMRLAPEMDAGAIYGQQSIKLSGHESKQELVDRLDSLGQELILNNLEAILEGRLKPLDQPSEGATYDSLITKEDGLINWQEPWTIIDRKIRAYAIWPKARTTIGTLDVAILKAHFENHEGEPGKYTNRDGSLGVYCQDGLVLIDQLLPAGSRTMSGRDFVLGYGKLLS